MTRWDVYARRKDLYFVKPRTRSYYLAICVSHYLDGKWSKRRSLLYPVSNPDYTADYFRGSNIILTYAARCNGKQDADIWVMDKALGME